MTVSAEENKIGRKSLVVEWLARRSVSLVAVLRKRDMYGYACYDCVQSLINSVLALKDTGIHCTGSAQALFVSTVQHIKYMAP